MQRSCQPEQTTSDGGRKTDAFTVYLKPEMSEDTRQTWSLWQIQLTIYSSGEFSLFHLAVNISISILGGHARPWKHFPHISIDISIMYLWKGGKQWISSLDRLSRSKRRREDRTEEKKSKSVCRWQALQLIWRWDYVSLRRSASSSGASTKVQTGAVNKAEALHFHASGCR